MLVRIPVGKRNWGYLIETPSFSFHHLLLQVGETADVAVAIAVAAAAAFSYAVRLFFPLGWVGMDPIIDGNDYY